MEDVNRFEYFKDKITSSYPKLRLPVTFRPLLYCYKIMNSKTAHFAARTRHEPLKFGKDNLMPAVLHRYKLTACIENKFGPTDIWG